jgi:hypothetical protein
MERADCGEWRRESWSRKRGLPVIGYVAETRVGVVSGLCGMNVRKVHE